MSTPSGEPSDTGSAIGRRRASAKESSREAYQGRRRQIIASAAQVFKDKGYGATTLADIAAAVNTDRATLYYYVGGKEELLDAVVSDVVRANLASAEQIRDSDDSPPAKLRRLVVDLMTSYERHYPYLYVFVQENLAHVPQKRQAWAKEMRAINRRYEETITSIIEAGIADGSIRRVDEPWVLTYGLLGMVAWTSRWFHPDRGGPDAAAIGATYADAFLNGILSAQAEDQLNENPS